MKILCVSHYYPPHMGGLEIVAKNQATRLAALGHEVAVVSSKVSDDETSGTEDGVRVVRVPALNILEKRGVPFPFFYPSLVPTLYRETKKADIVHIHDAFYISSFVAAVCAKLHRKPVVLMQHIAMINHPSAVVMAVQKLVYLTTGKLIFMIADRIITLNDRVEGFLAERGVPAAKLIAIPNGVDTTLFRPCAAGERMVLKEKYGLSTDKKVVVFVGRFVPKKGFQKLLAAKDSRYQIAFCGGDRPESVSADDTEVVFLGKRTPREVAEIYRASDMFALPSEDEGFPLSVQEAMATALPIVTSNDPGYARYQLDTKLVVLMDKPDGESLKRELLRLAADDALLARMSTYVHSYALEHFNWQRVMKQLEETYSALLVR